jgi:hypothetical protein
MNAKHLCIALSFALPISGMGCSEQGQSSAQGTASSPVPVVVEPSSDRWIGKWNGPEGTFLQLAGGKGKYEVTIRNLDGPRKFHGAAVGSGIEFERDGVKEVIRATNGDETGMKWLAGKSICLTVRVGEGFCRE